MKKVICDAFGDEIMSVRIIKEEVMKKVSVEQAIRVLNSALKADRKAVSELFNRRVYCNEKLAVHPTVQVREVEYKLDGEKRPVLHDLGVMGLINGIFGISKKRKGYGFICGNMNKKGIISIFEKTPRA